MYKAVHMTRWLACGTLAVALAFILVGCNGDSGAPSPTPTEAELTEPTPTVEPTPTPTAEPTPTPTPEPTLKPIDPNLSILDQFPAIERSCLLFNMEENRLYRIFNQESSATAEEFEAIAGCISRDTLTAMYLGGLASEWGGLSGETSACAVGRLEKMDKDALAVALFDRQRDLRSDDQVVLGYDREAIEDLEASIWHSIFLCLNKEEWTALSPSVDLNVDDVGIDALRCVLNELGPLGFVELFDAAEGATPSVEVFSAAENCEIDLESLLPKQTRPEPAPTATPQAQPVPTAVPPAPTAVPPAPTAVPAATPAPASTQAPFEKAPDFELPFYRNRAGEPGLRLSDLSGTPVVLNFWFAGCPPCRPTMSAIETVYKSGRWAEVLFLGIQIPLGTEQLDPDRGQAFAEEIGVSYALVFDAEEEVSRNYGIAGVPTTIVLDSYHNIVGRWAGVLDGNVLENLIRQIASPSPTAIPTPEPTSTPTPSPTPSLPPLVAMPGAPDYVKWQIGADVPSEVAEAVVEGTRLTHEYVVSLGLPEIRPDVEIYLHGDLDALASLYARLTGRSVEASREHWRNGYAEAGTVGIPGSWIIVKTSHPSSVESAYLPNLTKISAHELLHAYQDELSGLPASGVPDDEVPFHGPRWAKEGIAEFFAYKASDAGGVLSYDTKRANSVSHAKNMEKPLRGMETWEGGLKGYGYDLPLLGAELLASYAGEDALLRFYMLQRPGTTWQEAFETAFGMPVAEFYQLFEEHRAAGFLEPGSPESADGKMSAPGPFAELLQDPGLPSYINWKIQSEVDRAEVEDALLGIKLMYEFGKQLGMPDPEGRIVVYIDNDLERLASYYSELTGWDLESSRKSWEGGGAEAGQGWIMAMVSPPGETFWEPGGLVGPMAHELVHAAFQGGVAGLLTDSTAFEGIVTVPRWLGEGMAVFLSNLALVEHRGTDHSQNREWNVSQAAANGLLLQDVETWPSGSVGPDGELDERRAVIACIYQCGNVAVELLASRVGLRKLADYYMYVEPWMFPLVSEKDYPRPGWRLAFERAFGMTVEEFYELFEDHRAAGFPDPNRPTPTATPKPEPVAHPSDILDWFADPPDDKHSFAAKSIERIWDWHPDLAAGVARLNWVGDGITWNEEFVLEELSYVVSEDPELVRAVVNQEHRSYLLEVGSGSAERAADYPWLANELDARELYAIIGIARIAERNPGFAELVLGYTWLADGITEAEARGLGALSRWALLAPELVDRVLKYTWLDDGITDAEKDTLSALYSFAERVGIEAAAQVMDYQWLADGVTWEEVWVIDDLRRLVEDDPEAARQISRGTLELYLLGLVSDSARQAADYPWLADGLDTRELRTIIGIAVIAQKAQELAEQLLGYTWLADGVSERESNSISTLADIAHVNLELARQVVGMGILDDPLRDRDLHAITSLRRLVETDDLALLTSQPWFTDGLSDEETAFLVVTNRDQHSDSQYRDFLRTHFTRSATISLPLAGDVDLWVFWHLPFPDSDDSIELIEDAVRALEALMGVPFPTTDIILLLGDPDDISFSGYNAGSHMAMDRIVGEGNHRGVVYHETAHYYSMGIHSWFNEGFADLAVTYTMTRVGLRSFAERENYLEEYDLPECIELGFRNIQELLDKGGHACLGEFILVSLFNLLGEEATSAALRELYLMSGEQGEEDFYRIFLKHTPAGLEDEFRDLYRWLHGGPYADAEE